MSRARPPWSWIHATRSQRGRCWPRFRRDHDVRGRTISTEHGAWVSTDSETLPQQQPTDATEAARAHDDEIGPGVLGIPHNHVDGLTGEDHRLDRGQPRTEARSCRGKLGLDPGASFGLVGRRP